MSHLNERERELVAIGAAIGSNCVPCIEYHLPAGRKAGLENEELAEALELANKVKNVPAEKIYAVARKLVSGNQVDSDKGACSDDSCCG